MFPWATFRTTKAAVKMHTLLDLRGSIPSFIQHLGGGSSTTSTCSTCWSRKQAPLTSWTAPTSTSNGCTPCTKPAPSSLLAPRRTSAPIVSTLLPQTAPSGVHRRSNHRFWMACAPSATTLTACGAFATRIHNPTRHWCSSPTGPDSTRSPSVRCTRAAGRVELFFKWVKQHLRVKRFLGASENAVKSQLWVAVSVYVLVAILRKRLGIDTPLYTMLQILSVMPFEQVPAIRNTYDDRLQFGAGLFR